MRSEVEPRIVGVGEGAVDHVFIVENGQKLYATTRGGGSVPNVLSTLALYGASTSMIGTVGADRLGEYALKELVGAGIDCERLAVAKGRTRAIFELLRPGTDRTTARHQFVGRCLICGKGDEHGLARLAPDRRVEAELPEDSAIVIFDRLTNLTARVARTAHDRDVRSIVDVGRIGSLRYQPIERILAGISSFDVAVMPKGVSQSLVRRAGISGPAELFAIGPRVALVETAGADGMTVFHRRRSSRVELAEIRGPNAETILDDAGAGDAFVAFLVTALLAGAGDRKWTGVGLALACERATDQLPNVLRAIGARGHIPRVAGLPFGINPEWIGFDSNDLAKRFRSESPCVFCARASAQNGPRPLQIRKSGRNNVGLLVRRTFAAVRQAGPVAQCVAVLESSEHLTVIGTGGSFSAASFIATTSTATRSVLATAAKPLDFVRVFGRADTVVVVTYSGSTADCATVIEHANRIGVNRVVLLSASRRPALASLLYPGRDILISYGSPTSSSERGFVSIAGTVAPAALWTRALSSTAAMREVARAIDAWTQSLDASNLVRFADALRAHRAVSVIGGGFAAPAVSDVESKFTEARLALVQQHESKDFSHGRFMSLLIPDGPGDEKLTMPVLMLGVAPWHPFEREMIKRLSTKGILVALSTETTGILGALELLMKVQFLTQRLGELIGIDISQPDFISPTGLDLYKWRRG